MPRFPENEIMSLVGQAPRYDLGESVGPDLRLAELLDASELKSLENIALGYGTAEGDPRLRKVIADAHGVSADDVVTTMGGMHALFLLAFILCGRDTEAVTTSPLFPQARNALDVVGTNVHVLQIGFEGGYRLDLEELRQQLSPATRLVSLASPQNPSGVAVPLQTLREVLALLQEHSPEAYLLVDETYREAVYGDEPVAESAVTLSRKVISVASLSKCHGAPGLRLGWVITQDKALRAQLVLGKFNTIISCPPICEILALKVLSQQEQIIAKRRTLLAEGLARTAAWVQENREFVDWVRPDAGAVCCVRLKPELFDEAAVGRFYVTLAQEGGRVSNGAWFGDEGRVFRLGFGLLPASDLAIALNLLSSALKQTVQTKV